MGVSRTGARHVWVWLASLVQLTEQYIVPSNPACLHAMHWNIGAPSSPKGTESAQLLRTQNTKKTQNLK